MSSDLECSICHPPDDIHNFMQKRFVWGPSTVEMAIHPCNLHNEAEVRQYGEDLMKRHGIDIRPLTYMGSSDGKRQALSYTSKAPKASTVTSSKQNIPSHRIPLRLADIFVRSLPLTETVPSPNKPIKLRLHTMYKLATAFKHLDVAIDALSKAKDEFKQLYPQTIPKWTIRDRMERINRQIKSLLDLVDENDKKQLIYEECKNGNHEFLLDMGAVMVPYYGEKVAMESQPLQEQKIREYMNR